MTFGERLRELRKQHGLSQTEVAEMIAEQFPGEIRISQTSLSALEGRAKPPRGDVVEVLAQFFGVHKSWFYTDEDQSQIDTARAYLETLHKRDYSRRVEWPSDEGFLGVG